MVDHIFLINDYGKITGGQDLAAFEDFFSLKKAGLPVTLVTGVGPLDSRLKNLIKGSHIHFDETDIFSQRKGFLGWMKGLINLRSLFFFLFLLKKHRGESLIFHFHSFTKFFTPFIPWFLRLCGQKVVFTINDYFLCCPNGALYNFKSNCICNLKPLSSNCLLSNCDARSYYHKLWRFFRSVLFFNNLIGIPALSNNFIFVSVFSKKVFLNILPRLKNKNISVLPNKISFCSKKRILVENNRTFVFVGRMVSSKGPEQLLEALTFLDLPGMFIGDGPLLLSCKQKYPQFTFCGWLNNRKIKRNLSSCRALVFPSLWYEAQPIVPQEALSLGIPVITSNCNAAIEFIKDGYNGYHFDPNIEGDLIRVLRYFSEKKRVKNLSMNAFKSYSKLRYFSMFRSRFFTSFYKRC